VQNVSEDELRRLLASGHHHVRSALDRVSLGVLRDMAANAHLQTVAEGDMLEAEGSVGQKVGYLLEGVLAMIKDAAGGRSQIVGLLFPTDAFGRLTGDAAPTGIQAVVHSKLLYFNRDVFEDLLVEHPDLERFFLISVLDDLDAARDWILLLSGTSVTTRVATFLTMIARRQEAYRSGRTSPHITVKLPVSRKLAANALAIRPETLSRALHALADKSLIHIIDPATFLIPDLDLLLEHSNHDPEPSRTLGHKTIRNAGTQP